MPDTILQLTDLQAHFPLSSGPLFRRQLVTLFAAFLVHVRLKLFQEKHAVSVGVRALVEADVGHDVRLRKVVADVVFFPFPEIPILERHAGARAGVRPDPFQKVREGFRGNSRLFAHARQGQQQLPVVCSTL